LEKLKEHVVV
jgi:Reverse transcriptase (RNA-dependent DNA polymerase)